MKTEFLLRLGKMGKKAYQFFKIFPLNNYFIFWLKSGHSFFYVELDIKIGMSGNFQQNIHI